MSCQDKSSSWLAEQVGRNKSTASRWCRNAQQPDLETFYEVASTLDVPVCDLLVGDKG